MRGVFPLPDDVLTLLSMTYACDRQTDGWTDRLSDGLHYIARSKINDKNCNKEECLSIGVAMIFSVVHYCTFFLKS